MSFGAAFRTAQTGAGSAAGVAVLVILLTLLGVVLCYFPALLVGLALVHALPLVALHRRGAWQSLGMSYQVVRQDLGFHASFYGILVLLHMICHNIPVVGTMFVLAFHVRVHRELFGDGEEPVLEPRVG